MYKKLHNKRDQNILQFRNNIFKYTYFHINYNKNVFYYKESINSGTGLVYLRNRGKSTMQCLIKYMTDRKGIHVKSIYNETKCWRNRNIDIRKKLITLIRLYVYSIYQIIKLYTLFFFVFCKLFFIQILSFIPTNKIYSPCCVMFADYLGNLIVYW